MFFKRFFHQGRNGNGSRYIRQYTKVRLVPSLRFDCLPEGLPIVGYVCQCVQPFIVPRLVLICFLCIFSKALYFTWGHCSRQSSPLYWSCSIITIKVIAPNYNHFHHLNDNICSFLCETLTLHLERYISIFTSKFWYRTAVLSKHMVKRILVITGINESTAVVCTMQFHKYFP